MLASTSASHACGSIPLSLADRKSTRLNSSHSQISYAVFCLKKKNNRLAGLKSLYQQAKMYELARANRLSVVQNDLVDSDRIAVRSLHFLPVVLPVMTGALT